MPTLSMFYGIIIRMQSEKGGRHHKPHIHCLYGDDEIVIALDGEILEGTFPRNKLKLIEAWMTLHEDELLANWKLLDEGDGYFKIDPLK
ncbi:MAG: DUF4160 domain-containing protein [Lachnospiraceae bacterium]|nr:DUF4160 domain-containing protein [Lachnospiraceae bacterium]